MTLTSSNSTYERLHAILCDNFGRSPETVRPDATLHGNLMFDSLDLVDLVFMLRREFGVELVVDADHPARRVGDLVRMVEALSAEAA